VLFSVDNQPVFFRSGGIPLCYGNREARPLEAQMGSQIRRKELVRVHRKLLPSDGRERASFSLLCDNELFLLPTRESQPATIRKQQRDVNLRPVFKVTKGRSNR
jgi:hypothetical protein